MRDLTLRQIEVIQAVILSRLIDENWRRALMSEQDDLGAFFGNMLSSPLSLVLFLAVVLTFVSQTPLWNLVRHKELTVPDGGTGAGEQK